MKLSFIFLLAGIVLSCAGNEASGDSKSIPIIQDEVLVDSLNGQYKSGTLGNSSSSILAAKTQKLDATADGFIIWSRVLKNQ